MNKKEIRKFFIECANNGKSIWYAIGGLQVLLGLLEDKEIQKAIDKFISTDASNRYYRNNF